VLFGTWFNHYALPLFVPFAVVAAPLWRRPVGRIWLLIIVAAGGLWGQHVLTRHQITRGTADTLAQAVAATRGFHGCLFVYDGYPALYDATNSCLPTTRPFPAHLQSRNEMGATGIDEAAEVRRIMARRPDRVMTMEPAYEEENLAARAQIEPILQSEYREIYRYAGGSHEFVVYGHKPTAQALPS